MKLHYATKKAAVQKYGALLGTMPDDLLKGEIAKDEKLAPFIEEVFTAMIAQQIDEQKGGDHSHNPDAEKNGDDEQQGGAFDQEALDNFIETLTDEQAEKLFNALALRLGVDRFDFDYERSRWNLAKANAPVNSVGEFIVIGEFRDADDFNTVYSVGHDVSHFNEDRLNKLIANGLVEKQ